MPNPYIPRPLVHLWSESIGENAQEHQSTLQRLLRDQRRLTRFVEENSESMHRTTAGVAVYFFGVVARMFDLAGGRLRGATWEQVRAAEARIQGVIGDLLPLDDGLPDRLRKVEWRAQPHVLDEALMALLERKRRDNEAEVPREESLKIFFLVWVCVEVLDQNWSPPGSFEGQSAYEFYPIELPDEPDPAEAATEV
jgi:hypothetical protein